jgi:hypothetical protein
MRGLHRPHEIGSERHQMFWSITIIGPARGHMLGVFAEFEAQHDQGTGPCGPRAGEGSENQAGPSRRPTPSKKKTPYGPP